ncbi:MULTISPECIES: preprotein translocase subunit YajC [unclassified Corynebacterium]|uniref:preprotein translocase subunit YajC n=1 Tax=unclassified Corynebacterium TaxID=2624378 RepID=UPI0029CA670E|nr:MULTISPECIES: preprotein translocase subunit YajC [unclassified Corynebacterium]WPF65200.1 preprotein translocase subunit YajC [Corynebacterium sp. 22KM0430]WPF67695.1 preprotein translocase subunit YajC [Corynebacterium sp. 21KM1197]
MEWIFIIGLLMVFLVPQMLLISKQRKRQQEIMNTQRSLTPGTRVVTASGVHGTVRAVQGDVVELELAPGMVTTWELLAVVRNLDEEQVAAAQADSQVTEREHPENS